MEAIAFQSEVQDDLIRIPDQYRGAFSSPVLVTIIRTAPHETIWPVSVSDDAAKRRAAYNRLVGLTADNPVTLEEARTERLAKQ
jgi:hypothetical protein